MTSVVIVHLAFKILVHESRVQGKCIATPTRTTSFSKEKGATLGGTRTHDTLLLLLLCTTVLLLGGPESEGAHVIHS